ncbi:MAG: T9SS sorting signal type C domain-containing protein [Aquaticitalea sp.]
MIKKYSLVLIAVLCSVFSGFSQYSGTGTFTKINSAAALTDGYYIIANETDAFLMTNGRNGTDATGYFLSASVTPSANDIINPTADNVWLIETNGSGRTIYNETLDRYVGHNGGTSNSLSIETTPANSNRWIFSYSSGTFFANNVGTPARQLSYNAGAPRFAAYGNTGQQELQLYKLAAPSGPTITVTQATGGTISPGTTSVTSGSNQAFTVTPDACHTFTNWVVDGANAGSATTYTFNNITADHTITAIYSTRTYNITASAGINGTISPNGSTSVNCGSNQTYNFTPESGYIVDDVLVDGVSVGSPSSYTFNSINAPHTVSVTFVVYVGPCLEEDFESGLPTSYSTASFTLNSGSWELTNVIRGNAGVTSGSYSAQLRSATNSNIISPILTEIVDYITFNITGSTSSGAYQVNVSSDGGNNWTAAPGSPFSINTTTQLRTIDLNDPSINRIQIRRTAATIYVDDFSVFCDTTCVPTHSVTGFAPTSGPIGSYVTITGTGFTASSIVDFNGTSVVNYISQTGTELVVEVPAGSITGPISVQETGCSVVTSDFTILDNSGSCGGVNNLMMTEIYDSNGGSLGYIEVFNGTGSSKNLSNYSIRRYGDTGDLGTGNYTLYTFPSSQPTIANNAVLVGEVFSPGNTDSDYSENFTYDIDCSFTGGNYNCGGFNGADIFHLYQGTTLIDVYVVPSSSSEVGYVARRNTTTSGPNNNSNPSDWTYNSSESTSNLGIFNYTGASSYFPTISSPSDVTGCSEEAQFTSIASAGNGGALTYQWYFNNGTSSGWTLVNATNLPLTTVAGQTTNQLTLTNGFYNYDGYQFYCEVTESGGCSTVSNAAQLEILKTTWDGTDWLPTFPDSGTIAFISDDYDTSAGGQQISFSACQLIVDANYLLRVANGTFVEVENYTTVEGEILVETHGSFVQRADLSDGFILNSGGSASVNKSTAPVNNWYDYTYWSSPVFGATVGTAIDIAPTNRRFYYDAANYLDVFAETGNNDAAVAGHDDVDDNGDDWQLAPAGMVMAPGQGFAATVTNFGMFPGTRQVNFSGPFNTGTITTPIFYNGNNGDNDWNLIGNPYPSAVSFNMLYDSNTSLIDGAAYLWSQASAPTDTNNGNEAQNFNVADYAIISRFSGNTAGGDGVIPAAGNYIPSGQSFFVKGLANGGASFTNAMRMADLTSNNQFFRTVVAPEPNRLWVNLTTNNGIFNQLLVAYVDGGTNGDDGMAFDASRNLSSGVASIIYTLIDGSKKYAIQGKDPNSLNLDEIIPIGFYTSITESTTYTLSIADLKGEFMNSNTVYLKDNTQNVLHNLSASAYVFSSSVGEFNERFEIVFRDTSLSVIENEIPTSGLTIVELPNGEVKFVVGNSLEIKSVEIIDLLGRTLYKLQGNGNTEIYNLSNLSQSAYIAKVTLSNGQVITKRAVKRN